MEENTVMNEVVETVSNDVVETAGATRNPMNFGTGLAAGAIATVAVYGGVKLGRRLVKKFKDKKAAKESESENTASAKVDGKIIDGVEVVDNK